MYRKAIAAFTLQGGGYCIFKEKNLKIIITNILMLNAQLDVNLTYLAVTGLFYKIFNMFSYRSIIGISGRAEKKYLYKNTSLYRAARYSNNATYLIVFNPVIIFYNINNFFR